MATKANRSSVTNFQRVAAVVVKGKEKEKAGIMGHQVAGLEKETMGNQIVAIMGNQAMEGATTAVYA